MSIEVRTSTGITNINPSAVAAIVVTDKKYMEIHMMSGTIFTTIHDSRLLDSFKQGWE